LDVKRIKVAIILEDDEAWGEQDGDGTLLDDSMNFSLVPLNSNNATYNIPWLTLCNKISYNIR